MESELVKPSIFVWVYLAFDLASTVNFAISAERASPGCLGDVGSGPS